MNLQKKLSDNEGLIKALTSELSETKAKYTSLEKECTNIQTRLAASVSRKEHENAVHQCEK